MPEFDEKKELEEVLTDTKTIQKLLSDNDITDKQIMHTIPVYSVKYILIENSF